MDYATPMSQTIRANGERAWFGWLNIPPVEVAIAWLEAKTLEKEKAAARALNKAALADVIYAPLGFFLSYEAWRKNVTGIVKGPLPFIWGVSKAA
jgi:peptide/nickel transport system substrate-binding protein